MQHNKWPEPKQTLQDKLITAAAWFCLFIAAICIVIVFVAATADIPVRRIAI